MPTIIDVSRTRDFSPTEVSGTMDAHQCDGRSPVARLKRPRIFMASEIQTAPGETDETTPQRGATRAPVKKPVRLQFDDAIDIVEARCHNVSIGGMFVHSKEGRPVGSLVRFELMLDDDLSIRGLAEVVWMRAQDHGPERVAGMGLKFRFLEQRDRQLIFKLVSQHIKERLAARHPGLGDDQEVDDPPQAPPLIRKPASTMERVTRSSEVLPSIDDLDDPSSMPPQVAQTHAAAEIAEDESGQRSLLFRSDNEDEEAAPEPAPGPTSEPTGAWLQQGLRDEAEGGFKERAGFGGDDSGAHSAPAYSTLESFDEPSDELYGNEDPSELEGYETDLYGDDETHFEHRPRPRRDIPVLTLAAVLVTVLAVSAYLWGDKLFSPGSGDDVTPAPLAGDSATRSDPPTTDSAAADSKAADPIGPDSGAPDPGASDATGREPAGSVSGPAPAESPSTPSAPTTRPAATQPATTQPSQTAAPSRPFRVVRDISARVAGPSVEVVITTDGGIEADRFSHARLPDGAPRELIKLRGLTERFATERIPVGIGAVRQIRTGWHRKSSGNELHIVVDLADAAAQVTGVRVEGNRLIVSIRG